MINIELGEYVVEKPGILDPSWDLDFRDPIEKSLEDLFGNDTFPPEVIVICFPQIEKHKFFNVEGVPGLAVFSSEGCALRFLEFFVGPPCRLDILELDEARELAKSKSPPIMAIHLLDKLDFPVTHFVV